MAKILIIDDDEDFRSMLRDLLKRAAYTVIEARDGKEGIKRNRAERPDLIITDIIMPNEDGIGTILSLKDEFPQSKIIAISGGGLVQPYDYLHMAEELGANLIFIKPMMNQQFLKAVHDLLEE